MSRLDADDAVTSHGVRGGPRGPVEISFLDRETADVDVERVQAGIIAVSGKLQLELDLLALHWPTTDRAVSAPTGPSPHAVWAPGR